MIKDSTSISNTFKTMIENVRCFFVNNLGVTLVRFQFASTLLELCNDKPAEKKNHTKTIASLKVAVTQSLHQCLNS